MVIEQARWRLDSPLRRARGRRPLLLAQQVRQQVRRDALQQNQARYIVHVMHCNSTVTVHDDGERHLRMMTSSTTCE